MTAAAPRPLQARSRATCDRIVAATRALLAEQVFEDLTVQQIAARARTSVGSFYNLFTDKEALLPELYRRHCAEIVARLDAFCDRERWRDRSLVEIVRALVKEIVALHRAERGLLRTLVLRGHTQARSAERPDEMREVLPRLAALLASRRAEISHPVPRRGAATALLMALATVREAILYPQTTAYAVGLSDRSLQSELQRAICAHLGAA